MLSRFTILTAFNHLSDELGKLGILGELNVVGGTAMLACDFSLAPDWLNHGAKGYLSAEGTFSPLETIELPNLRVQAPTPDYMLAMKVLAARRNRGRPW